MLLLFSHIIFRLLAILSPFLSRHLHDTYTFLFCVNLCLLYVGDDDVEFSTSDEKKKEEETKTTYETTVYCISVNGKSSIYTHAAECTEMMRGTS